MYLLGFLTILIFSVKKYFTVKVKIYINSLGGFKKSHKLFHEFFGKHHEYSLKTLLIKLSYFFAAKPNTNTQ